MRIFAAAFFFFAAPALAQQQADFIASPTVARAAQASLAACSSVSPCNIKDAVERCMTEPVRAGVCNINLTNGVYLDPEIIVYYYRFAHITGNCNGPGNVILRATRPQALIWVQDHAIAAVGCLMLEAAPGVNGVIGISGRQHVVVDYWDIYFGAMPNGTHVAMEKFSQANCGGENNYILGEAITHIGASRHSDIDLPCRINIATNAVQYLVSLNMLSTANMMVTQWTGFWTSGVGASCQAGSFVNKPPGVLLHTASQGTC